MSEHEKVGDSAPLFDEDVLKRLDVQAHTELPKDNVFPLFEADFSKLRAYYRLNRFAEQTSESLWNINPDEGGILAMSVARELMNLRGMDYTGQHAENKAFTISEGQTLRLIYSPYGQRIQSTITSKNSVLVVAANLPLNLDALTDETMSAYYYSDGEKIEINPLQHNTSYDQLEYFQVLQAFHTGVIPDFILRPPQAEAA